MLNLGSIEDKHLSLSLEKHAYHILFPIVSQAQLNLWPPFHSLFSL